MKICVECEEEFIDYYVSSKPIVLCSECDNRLNYPIDYVYDELKSFPKEREFTHCNKKHIVSNLAIYGTCEICNQKIKLRSFGAPKEIQDIILLVKDWLKENDNG